MDDAPSLRSLLRDLVDATGSEVALLLDADGTLLASAGRVSPLGPAQHALTIAQGILAMIQVTGITPSPESITDADHGVDGRMLISIIQSRYILALRVNRQRAEEPHAAFLAIAVTLEELL